MAPDNLGFGFTHEEYLELHDLVKDNANAIKVIVTQVNELHKVVIGGNGNYRGSLINEMQLIQERVRIIATEHTRFIEIVPVIRDNERRIQELETKVSLSLKQSQAAIESWKEVRSKAIGIGIGVGLGTGIPISLLQLFS